MDSSDVQLQQFGFTLYIDPIKTTNFITTASLFPQFKEQLPHVVNLTCGDVFFLPEILDLRDADPIVNFNFNLATSFMKGSKNNITIDMECLAGFYPIAIRLNNTYNAVTRYQFIIVIQKSQGLPTTNQIVKNRLSQLFNG